MKVDGSTKSGALFFFPDIIFVTPPTENELK